jgi:hypothetical protein
MSHDLEDLLNLIKELEERIIKLERKESAQRLVQHEDSWYWEHG